MENVLCCKIMALCDSIWPQKRIHMDSTNFTKAACKDIQFITFDTVMCAGQVTAWSAHTYYQMSVLDEAALEKPY